jgi:DNA-binding Xre family transcriptional regulator
MSEESQKEVQDTELSLEELDKVAGGKITFKPFLNYMKEHDISMYTLIKEGVITPTESTRIRADHNFRLSFVDRLCGYLGCQIWDVIDRIPDDVEDNSIDELLAGL